MIPILSGAKALLVNTEKDNNMISIVESIAVGTPIISTTIPLNASYIKSNKLGIVEDNWGKESLIEIVKNNSIYVENCNNYRQTLSTDNRVKQFIRIINDEK